MPLQPSPIRHLSPRGTVVVLLFLLAFLPLQLSAQPAAKVLQTGQITAYGAGSDGDLQLGAVASYTDNGDGTITDDQTGLMWEKKCDDGGIHDKDNTYTWGLTASPYNMNGTAVTEFLQTLNTEPCFAEHCDWRLPNVRELQSILRFEAVEPAVAGAFNNACSEGCKVAACSCTVADNYWSSTTYRDSPQRAWLVGFHAGNVNAAFKSTTEYVRAVRGGK